MKKTNLEYISLLFIIILINDIPPNPLLENPLFLQFQYFQLILLFPFLSLLSLPYSPQNHHLALPTLPHKLISPCAFLHLPQVWVDISISRCQEKLRRQGKHGSIVVQRLVTDRWQ